MAFQPFGFHFELTSPLPPDGVKAAIRSRKQRWLDPKNGARGWIVGPFICLWWTVWRRQGPMLLGRITEDGARTRISGRAGSDLNGIAMLVLVSVGMIPLLWLMIASGQASLLRTGLLAIFVAVCAGLTLAMASKDRKEAEPLVRFLQKTVTKQDKAGRQQQALPAVSAGIILTVNGEARDGPLTAEAIQDALENLGPDDFAILEHARERYLQGASTSTGWILEKREGDALRHFRAERSDGSTSFSFDEMLGVFLAYACDRPMPSVVTWRRMQV